MFLMLAYRTTRTDMEIGSGLIGIVLYSGSMTDIVGLKKADLLHNGLWLYTKGKCHWRASRHFLLPGWRTDYVRPSSLLDRLINNGNGVRKGPVRVDTLTIPLVPLIGVAVVPCAYFVLTGKRSKPRGKCRKCGYDLTGNVSGICPECGTPIPDGQKRLLAKESDAS
jgi:hypothetical protein